MSKTGNSAGHVIVRQPGGMAGADEITCGGCQRPLANYTKKFNKPEQLKSLRGATITYRHAEAPRVRCMCGQLTILMKGSMG